MKPIRAPRPFAATENARPDGRSTTTDGAEWLSLALIEDLCLVLGERHGATPEVLAAALELYRRELRRRAVDGLALLLVERLAARARGARIH